MELIRTGVTLVVITLTISSWGEAQVPAQVPCQPGTALGDCQCLNTDGTLCSEDDDICQFDFTTCALPDRPTGGSGGTDGGPGSFGSCLPGSSFPFIPCTVCLNADGDALCMTGDSNCTFGPDPTKSLSECFLPGGGSGGMNEDISCDEEPNGKESCCTCDEERNVWDCPMPILSQGCTPNDDAWDCCNCICDSAGRWDCDPDPEDVGCLRFTASQMGGFGACQMGDIVPGGSRCLICVNDINNLPCESSDQNCLWSINPFCGGRPNQVSLCEVNDIPPSACSACQCLNQYCEACEGSEDRCAWRLSADVCCLNIGDRRRDDRECEADDSPPVCCQGCTCLNPDCEDCGDGEECVWQGSMDACLAGSSSKGGMSRKNSTESMGGMSGKNSTESKGGMSMKNSTEGRGSKGGKSLDDFDLSNLPLGGRCDPDKDTETDTTIPCLNCGCFPSEERGGPQGRYKCQLYGNTPSCRRLQNVWEILSGGCDRGDTSPIDEDQCQCECNPGLKEWKCRVTAAANGVELSPVCQLALKQKDIELPPARTQDISALYPQSCESGDMNYLMGNVTVEGNCNVCVCVDGCWQCVEDENNCDSDGMVIQSVVSCSDRESPFYPLGTYTQQGPSYSICVFGSFQDATFTATMRKPGTCPVTTPPADLIVCEGMVNECVFDIECTGGEKCCFGDCETSICVTPDYPPECPEVSETSGVDLILCEEDANCTTGQLCCSTGPGYECIESVTYDPMNGMANPIVPSDEEESIDLQPCDVNGVQMPTGSKWTDPDDICTECVCLNGNPECYSYSTEDCVIDPLPPLPTCSCGPPGTDLAQQVIPFGTVWHVSRCDVCVCLRGEWICRQISQCRPDVAPPRPCQLSGMIAVPTGHISDNGCCVCIDGQWTCDRPGCTETGSDAPSNCEAEDGSEVRHGSYTVEECILCICVNGNIRCINTCENKGGMMNGGNNGMMADDRVCPAASVRCPSVATDRNECTVDAECPVPNSVCCTNGCVNICIEPADAGVAVACPEVMCTDPERDISQCEADVNCTEGTVCCRDRRGCFGRCVAPPALPKPGICPSVTVPPQIPTSDEAAAENFNVFGDCSVDSDCMDNLKCCGGAIKECTEPQPQPQPAQCTDTGGTSRESGYIETGVRAADLNVCNVCVCIDGSWICEEFECTDAAPEPTLLECDVPGMRVPQPSGVTIILECLIRVCFNGQWLVRDLIACQDVRVEKPGECPRGELLPEMTCPDSAPIPECTGDQTCTGEQKCCFNGCTVLCLDPIEERAGECPVATAGDLTGTCPAAEMDSCSLDTDCPNDGSKCCFDGCRKSCQAPAVIIEDPVCQDMEDPSAPPYSNGQVVTSGECNICVCVGTDWLCTQIPDEACNTTLPNNCYDGSSLVPTIPSGTLQRSGCLQRVCLNGTWETSFADDCCPDLTATCAVDGVILSTGETRTVVEGDICNACICVSGIMICQQLMATSCMDDTVNLPCWRGSRSVPSGAIITQDEEICGCFFGQWKCFTREDEDAEIDIKPGRCPESFAVLEPDVEDQGPSKSGKSKGQGSSKESSKGSSKGRGQGGSSDGWGASGVAGRDSGSGSKEEDTAGVIDAARGPSQGRGPPQAQSKGASKGQSKGGSKEGGQSGQGGQGGQGGGQGGQGQGGGREGRGARRKRQDQADEVEDEEVDEEQEEIQDAIDELQDTMFDACEMDSQCRDQQICCGLALGGTCTDPLPEESIPLPCSFNDRYYRHGSLRDESEGGVCEACVCVHGEWTCDEYDCDVGLYECIVGYEIYSLTVPSGSQQFLQCELCVCLNGEWICNERACADGESEALCPAGVPPGINPRNPNSRCTENEDCEEGNKCCEYENFGRVCVPPQMPNVKNGECPSTITNPCQSLKTCFTDSNCPGMMKCCRPEDVLDRCNIDNDQGVCTNPAGNPCPGNRPLTPCDGINPCEEGCTSNPDLTCQVSECSSCHAEFYDENGKEKKCRALEDVRCVVDGRPPVRGGNSVDNPAAPCNRCFCRADGELVCNDEPCGDQRRLSFSFAADNCEDILNDTARREEFSNQIRQILLATVGVDARDPSFGCGSIIANISVIAEDGQVIDDQLIEDIKTQVESGELVIVIDGVEYLPNTESFTEVKPEPIVTSTTVIIIAVLVTIVILAIIIAGTLCYLKTRKNNNDQQRGDVPMKSAGGYDNSTYQ